jgi:hypothetical protein
MNLACSSLLMSLVAACGTLASNVPNDAGGTEMPSEASKDAPTADASPVQTPLDWHEVSSSGPSARIEASMTYDSNHKVTILFGGMDSASGDALSDTWEWNGTTWTQKSPSTSPPARFGAAFAYDSARQVAVLFGGDIDDLPPPPVAADTWEWDGTNWAQQSPATQPPGIEWGAMALDSRRDVAVLYTGLSHPDDTWEWNGTTWAQESPATSPPQRTGFALAYDADHFMTVMFGGLSTASGDGPVVVLADGWNWSGTAWTEMPTTSAPPARWGHTMTYDAARGSTVLFGGQDAAGNLLDDTWEYDGVQWVEASPSTRPPARTQQAMAYDSDRQVTVMFGGNIDGGDGFPDTWEFSAP